jgi:serine/threonine-protein kinase
MGTSGDMADVVAGRYRLDQFLGRGAMSEVWQATDLELDRHVALKFLAVGADTGRFEREARAVASLSHPNVTRVYDFGSTAGRAFMVLEYLEDSLEERLRRQAPLDDESARRIAIEVAAGLAHAHANGVIHRDLKPANVLFDGEGRAKLADFGVARILAAGGTLTDPGTLIGTSAYMSPEQASGAPAAAASDVYSFGVVLHRMLTGRLPFESSSAFELVRLHRDENPPPITAFRPDVPPGLAAVVTAAMAKDPARRPPDGAALHELLTRPDRGPTAVTEVIPPARRQRTRRPLMIALLAALALSGAALAWVVTRPAGSSAPPATQSAPTHDSTHAPTTTQPAPTTAAAATTRPTTTAHTTTRRETTSTAAAPTTTARTTTAATTVPTAPTTTAVTSAPVTTTAPTTTPPTTTQPATTVTTAPTTTGP